ncbi:MAG: hypothetical protein LBJ61_05985, partial [Deltaproteobacteria bacterium]|nr:hypothetical protein [Deltaproteobacteria bacterium]
MAEIIVDDDVNSKVAGNAPPPAGTFSTFSDLLNNGITTEGYSIIIDANIGDSPLYMDVYGAARQNATVNGPVSVNRNSVTVNSGNMAYVYGGRVENSLGDASA